MMIRKLSIAGILAALITPLLLQGAHAADSSLLNSNAPDRQAKLEAAAKAEGSLTLYTSLAKTDVDPLIKPFEEKYGIKVEVWRAGSDDILQKVIQEQKAGRFAVDAIQTSSPELEALSRENLLQPVNSPYFANLLPGTLPSHHNWAGTFLAVWVQAYNTGLVRKEDLPKTYKDLLDPKWKGKLGYEADDIDWFMTVIDIMGKDEGLDFFEKLSAGNGVSVRKGHSLLNNLVVAGEVPLGLTVYNYMPAQAKQQGAPIDWFAIQPAVARASGTGVLKNAQHPNAAALFEDYMLSEAQPVLTTLNYIPTSKTAKSSMEGIEIRVADPAGKLDNLDKWEPLYKKLIIGKGTN